MKTDTERSRLVCERERLYHQFLEAKADLDRRIAALEARRKGRWAELCHVLAMLDAGEVTETRAAEMLRLTINELRAVRKALTDE